MHSDARKKTIAPSLKLEESMRDLLRAAARHSPLTDVTNDLHADTRTALDRVCHLARLEGLRAEELLLLLKECWRRLPESQRVDRADAATMLDHVITHCIKAFYGC